jgi:hypothetical protein
LLSAAAERDELPASPEAITIADGSEPNQRSRLGRLDALLAKVAQVPRPHEALRKDNQRADHDRKTNRGKCVSEMISRTEEQD